MRCGPRPRCRPCTRRPCRGSERQVWRGRHPLRQPAAPGASAGSCWTSDCPKTACETAAFNVLQDCRADARCPGLPGFVGTQVRGENDDVFTWRDAVEGIRHRAPAAPERAVDEDEVWRTCPLSLIHISEPTRPY